MDTVTWFGEKFHVAAGRQSTLKKFADKIGVRWLVGGATARASFGFSGFADQSNSFRRIYGHRSFEKWQRMRVLAFYAFSIS
jgi:hypothetical protein